MTVQIGSRQIGAGHLVYVIAEIGSNHDGDLGQARELIAIAAECGADAAKFQLYRAGELYPGRITPGALPDAWLPELKACCESNRVEFLCSVFSLETLEAYLAVAPAAVKIASPEAYAFALIGAACESGLPVIVSTGACDFEDVRAVSELAGGDPLVLLHCVSAYPAPFDAMNLLAMAELAVFNVPVGLSDHTLASPAPVVAVALGASVIEKHLTLSRSLVGPDHPFALDPDEFGRMVRDVHAAEVMLGDGVKRVAACEDATDRRVAA